MNGNNSSSNVKRLAPRNEVARELFLKSGNECAFPGCSTRLISENGKFVGQICHIEAAEKGGQRFNEKQTNEERRAFGNLMLLCYAHHVETNDEKIYDVPKMKEIKRKHEDKFSSAVNDIVQSASKELSPIPILNFQRVDTGTQKWTRDYSEEFRRKIPALTEFVLECTNGESCRSEIINYKSIFTSISPTSFKKNDKVSIFADANSFDEEFINKKESENLIIKFITPDGLGKNVEFKFDGFKCIQQH